MPALVTTPIDVPVDGINVPIKQQVSAVATRTPTAPSVPIVNVSGVTRAVTGLPIKRWNGTSWQIQYKPRF
jgi:hypothetical protein